MWKHDTFLIGSLLYTGIRNNTTLELWTETTNYYMTNLATISVY